MAEFSSYKEIMEGDVRKLVEEAKRIGSDLAKQLTTSQIRNVFGEVRKIEMNWPAPSPVQDGMELSKEELAKYKKQEKQAEDAHRRAALLRPKLAYQARAERGRGVQELQKVLDPCLKIVQNADAATRKLYFDRFVDFFEAILAFTKPLVANKGDIYYE